MIPYIINVALILTGCLIFYKLLLRKETFYKMNRYVLVLCLFISFGLPLLPVPQQWSLQKKEVAFAEKQLPPVQAVQAKKPEQEKVTNTPAVTTTPSDTKLKPAQSGGISMKQIMTGLFWLYWFGVIVFALNFLLQIVILVVRSRRNPVIIDGQYRIAEVTGDKAPCSFGNTIFINPEKYEWDTYNQILLHEKVHIRQKHSLDILAAELMLIFQWFNPFAWVYRREVESNLEFLTDDQLTQKEAVEKTSYQLNLLKVSAPHFPLSLTTNYNQSILKKRIAMMNAKRSNLHTGWKYFFLLPLLAFFACLLNEPMAKAQTTTINENKGEKHKTKDLGTEGYWFAVIKDDKINIRFSDDQIDNDDLNLNSGHSFSATTFKLSELGTLPKGSPGTFNILREAGKMEMTGKFEGNTGMGRYKFISDKAFIDYMNAELKDKLDEDDQMAFFFIDIKKDYLQTLKKEGYSNITKDDIIPMAAMHIDAAYIRSIKNAGFKDVSLENLIPLKALGIDEKYIQEIRSAGYKNVTTDQLVTFKAQGIDKEYIGKVRQLKGNENKNDDDDADDIVSFKAMGITEEYINSFKAVGITNIPNDELVSFKALGVTPEYIKSWHNAGFKDIAPEEFVGMKSQNVTPEYMKSFTDMGYKKVDPTDLVAFRALGITPEFVKSFEAAGYKNIEFDELPALKSQNITPEYIKSFEEVGFKNIALEEIISVKALGVTPAYIKEMRSKGFNYDKIQKYVTLKSID
jgi:beta-lactamase regulating signal transducer with metallopeptidase domain